ncbi:MAG: GNAT family N-acetyltransferase [Natronospirillum sp.]|uniref:GNAT family N-acetyltransferase n=1 Tax=Natronospirillum sp. TaxID=2812955 RepID=UPI0025DFE010|nr:GNAT family N-acetyltransferase [Natronospirillum sp.]MCH8550933.1 GNAT family N-acetyltransferase [Natronospirillum sp.]
MSELTIVPARPDQVPVIMGFIRALAIYENAEDQVEATEEDIQQALFGEDATTHGVICFMGDQPVGFAIYFFNFSTWTGKRGIYLEDLFVDPEYRGHGAGKALLQYLAKLALDKDCRRFEWSVLDWNTPSIAFYESLGARPMSEWIGYRVDGEALERLAQGV